MAAEWQERAKCRGQDPERWATANLPSASRRAMAALMQCDGCAVWRECGFAALEMTDFNGMVVAGVAFPEGTNKIRHARKVLRVRLGLPATEPRAEMPNHCADCERPLVAYRATKLPKAHARYHGHGLCVGCYSAKRRGVAA
ncbi:WhiB family transcriptional regulator [Rhodococcus sp. UNC363MFTsu5.1]|uniref:WhiB family transcriptional regulator n=1 Tax=Rhodococcus sp. UNC363MFTsu5.1 TaxID=1449069 RepID=UPI000B235905|nr:WhiB family transcriptional regulator [Rhodococcus sp. UNC363MFTsu5.1]